MEKIKGFLESNAGKDILVVLIIILVGLGSFELGRLSKASSSTGVKISFHEGLESPAGQANALNGVTSIKTVSASPNQATNSGKNFFASSRGSKYYTVGCSAGKTIKQENRVYFTTSDAAEAAGYALSSSCK
jgi:hypothetical protein